ncbi:hypothetical protein AYO44_07390 [Planctomycetaceae bacterium SCGC AG-212-F19]|nr:hypothetical protein AYO44_07390 [Planctomycetaceae bacterium SCGC AG-212-F19]
MNRLKLALAVAMGIALSTHLETASANPPKAAPSVHPHTPNTHGPGVRPVHPGYTPPRVHPTPHVVPRPRVVPQPPVVVPAAVAPGYGVPLTMGAWVGYNSSTGMYSIAFDSPGVAGSGILIQAGYSQIILGPTTWTGAVSYLKSVGAPGW